MSVYRTIGPLVFSNYDRYIYIHVVSVYMEENMCSSCKKIDVSICCEYNVDFQAIQIKVLI